MTASSGLIICSSSSQNSEKQSTYYITNLLYKDAIGSKGYKRITQKQPDGRDARSRYVGRGRIAPTPSLCELLSLNLHMFTIRKLSEPHDFYFYGSILMGTLNH